MTTPKQLRLPQKPITIETKRKCANRDCDHMIDKASKYDTCSWRCFQATKAEREAIEAADKDTEGSYPF